MKHPGLQHQNRLRHSVDDLCGKKGTYLGALAEVRALKAQLASAENTLAEAVSEFRRAVARVTTLINAESYNEDGLPPGVDFMLNEKHD